MLDTPGFVVWWSAFILEVIMAIKKVFVDDEGNELRCHINTDNKLYITTGDPDGSEFAPYYSGCIVLDKEDVIELISELNKLVEDM